MNRFTPWIFGGIAAVGATIAGTYVLLTPDTAQLPPENDAFHADCSQPDDIAPITDLSLREAILDAIEIETGVRQQEVSCAALAILERLDASDKGIFDLTGLEYAQSLTYLDLSKNILLEVGSLRALFGLEYLNLTGTTLAEFDTGSIVTLRELYLGNNSIVDINFVKQYHNVTHLGMQNNAFADVAPFKEMSALQFLAIYGDPIDWSDGGAEQVELSELQGEGIDVIHDELEIPFGVNGTEMLSQRVSPDTSIRLEAAPTMRQYDDWYKIKEVEFYEVTNDGVLVTIGLVEEAPFSMEIAYTQDDIGLHKYAAEVRTSRGATKTVQPDSYVRIEVAEQEPDPEPEREPQCRANTDCTDNNQCTTDVCRNGVCTFSDNGQCIQNETGLCSDSIDNDQDGNPDCDDTDCFEDVACARSEPPTPITCKPLSFSCGAPDASGTVYCSLSARGNQCSASLFSCKDGNCKRGGQPISVGTCVELQQLIRASEPNSSVPIASGDFYCGDIYMCSRIILCAK